MLQLSDQEYAFTRNLRGGETQTLYRILDDRLDLSKGVIAIFCIDPYRACNKMRHVVDLVAKQCNAPEPVVSPITEIGGPLCFVEETRIVPVGSSRARDMIRTIGWIMEQTEIRTILSIGHAPCLGAAEVGISIDHNLTYNTRAKTRLEHDLRRFNPTVVPLFHVDYTGHRPAGEKQQLTYFFSPRGWKALCPIPDSAHISCHKT